MSRRSADRERCPLWSESIFWVTTASIRISGSCSGFVRMDGGWRRDKFRPRLLGFRLRDGKRELFHWGASGFWNSAQSSSHLIAAARVAKRFPNRQSSRRFDSSGSITKFRYGLSDGGILLLKCKTVESLLTIENCSNILNRQ